MKYIFSVLMIVFVTASTVFAASSSSYSTLTDGQKKQFYERLESEIAKTNAEFIKLTEQISKVDPIEYPSLRIKLEKVSAQLMTKQTLFENFYETPSIQSPLIRDELIGIFSKNEITPFDLSRLQNLVAREKPKVLKSR